MIKSFNSLTQRIMYGYIATFPSFVPVQSISAPESAQQKMHGFMKKVAEKLYEKPGLLRLPTYPDDCYEWWELQNIKPELIDNMRKISKKVDEFYQFLLRLGEVGILFENKLHVNKSDLKVSPKKLEVLSSFGLMHDNTKQELILWSSDFPDLMPGWKLLADNSRKNSLHPTLFFSRCIYDVAYSHSRDIFYSLVEDKAALNILETYFDENKYTRVDYRNDGITLDWVKNYGKKDEPLKGSWGERDHGGLSILFDYKKRHPVIFGLRVPMFKELLKHFDEMDDDLKAFVLSKTKKCDGCRYCTQTDKTGTRQLQIVSVNNSDVEYDLCTLYPGFRYIWTTVDETTAAMMIKFLKFIDGILGKSAF